MILACRDQEKATETMHELTADTGNENIVVGILDLASLSSVRRFAEEFNNSKSPVLGVMLTSLSHHIRLFG